MSIKHLTFKEYLDSKEQLIDSLKNEPIAIKEYVVSNYCKISLGESIKDKNVLMLKPNDTVNVEWNYTDKNAPQCLSVMIENTTYGMYWKNDKITKWIQKNTKDL